MDISLIVGIIGTILTGISLKKAFWDSLDIEIQIKKVAHRNELP